MTLAPDGTGGRVPSGVYFLLVRLGNTTSSHRRRVRRRIHRGSGFQSHGLRRHRPMAGNPGSHGRRSLRDIDPAPGADRHPLLAPDPRPHRGQPGERRDRHELPSGKAARGRRWGQCGHAPRKHLGVFRLLRPCHAKPGIQSTAAVRLDAPLGTARIGGP
jgi:hypothetical protein